ncbi:hypothetical protein C1926_15820 [Stenotrophomonas sp. ZAC14A_NAIMI4_1]|nr:hypothetical protein C1926_15820 [Stenotrophomonas sp. ZAC14A_NAIMI4_1]
MHRAWDAAKTQHLAYFMTLVSGVSTVGTVGGRKLFLEMLKDRAEQIAVGSPSALQAIINEVDCKLGIGKSFSRSSLQKTLAAAKKKDDGASLKGEERTAWDFLKTARDVLSYSSFSKKGNVPWNAYALCGKFPYRLCPYCQQAFAFTLQESKDGSGFRPPLDHFYAKAIYPYLGLSLYNLVPSCQTCNSSLKGNIDFHEDKHLNPFEDAEEIKFEVNARTHHARKKDGRGLIAVQVAPVMSPEANRSCETFRLKERYDFNDYEITRWVDALQQLSSKDFSEFIAKYGASRDAWEAALLQFNPADYHNEMLGRIKLDIMNSYKGAGGKWP